MLSATNRDQQVEFDVWIAPGAAVHFLFFSAVNISAISLSSKALSLYVLLPEAVKSEANISEGNQGIRKDDINGKA